MNILDRIEDFLAAHRYAGEEKLEDMQADAEELLDDLRDLREDEKVSCEPEPEDPEDDD